MVPSTRESGSTVWRMVEELSLIPRDLLMRANGWTTSSTVLDLKLGTRAKSSLKESTSRARRMGAVVTNGPTEASTKETSSTVFSKVKVRNSNSLVLRGSKSYTSIN